MRRLIKNQRARIILDTFQYGTPVFFCFGQKSDKGKPRRVHARCNKSRKARIGSGKRNDRDMRGNSQLYEVTAGVADGRHTGIAYQCQHAAFFEFFNKLRPFFCLVMFMVTRRRRINTIGRKEQSRMACILCRDQICFPQAPHGPVGDIFHIAYGRSTQIQCTFLKLFSHHTLLLPCRYGK